MTLRTPPTPLVISMTQGSADAFVQGSVLTGISGRQAYNVRRFALQLVNAAALSAIAADYEITVAITRRSKTAIPNISDSDVIWMSSFYVAATTSGVVYVPAYTEFTPDYETPIVEETIYAQLDSTATGVAVNAIVRLEVDIDTMSDIDRLNLITRSLT